jgi:hypothetical protein
MQVGVDERFPVSIWVNQKPERCLLRGAAMTEMPAKPSDTAFERLWIGFGDHLRAKRRSFKNGVLATVPYAKMNHRVLGTHGNMNPEAQFDSLLDFVEEVVEEELVLDTKGGVQNEQNEQC